MSTEEEYRARGNWNQIKGKIRQEYGNLTDDDVEYSEGQQDEWLGKLQEKTGKAKGELKRWIDSL